jgi:opacity protein-like surface antigen
VQARLGNFKDRMTRKKAVVSLIFLSAASFLSAQDVEHFNAAVSWSGVFSKSTSSYGGGVTLKPTTSGAVLGTFRFRFNHMHGVELNIGHTSNSHRFLVGPDTYRVNTDITEYTGAYVFSPFRTGKLEAFLLAGAGALKFSPGSTYIDGFSAFIGASAQKSIAVLYGGGVDYHLWKAFSARLQYRGLFYKDPNFHVQTLVTGARGHMAEPSAGIVVVF